ncbi:hypothetical protein D9M71_569150 [compost metagenome]
MALTQPPRAIWPITTSSASAAIRRRLSGSFGKGAKARDRRRDNRNSKLNVVKPPSKCAVTTCGHSFRVTVHIPKAAWASTTPSSSIGRR